MLAVLFLSAVSVYAQVAADIHDFFYADLERWETLGLVKNLPHARPYPLQVIKPALESVMEKGDPVQRAIADAHYRRFFSRTATFGGKSEAALDVNSANRSVFRPAATASNDSMLSMAFLRRCKYKSYRGFVQKRMSDTVGVIQPDFPASPLT